MSELFEYECGLDKNPIWHYHKEVSLDPDEFEMFISAVVLHSIKQTTQNLWAVHHPFIIHLPVAQVFRLNVCRQAIAS